MSLGFSMDIQNGLEAAADADLIAVPAHQIGAIDPRYLEVIRAAAARGALGAQRLQRRLRARPGGRARRPPRHHPLDAHRPPGRASTRGTEVDPDVLFVEDGNDRHQRRHGRAASTRRCTSCARSTALGHAT